MQQRLYRSALRQLLGLSRNTVQLHFLEKIERRWGFKIQSPRTWKHISVVFVISRRSCYVLIISNYIFVLVGMIWYDVCHVCMIYMSCMYDIYVMYVWYIKYIHSLLMFVVCWQGAPIAKRWTKKFDIFILYVCYKVYEIDRQGINLWFAKQWCTPTPDCHIPRLRCFANLCCNILCGVGIDVVA